MFVLIAVALLWNAAHEADIPDTAPYIPGGHSLVKNPDPLVRWTPPVPVSDGQWTDTQRHAQRGDAGPER